MHLDIEKLAREAGLSLLAIKQIERYTALALEDVAKRLAQDLAQREVNDVDDMPQQGCVDLIRALSRQITEDTTHGR